MHDTQSSHVEALASATKLLASVVVVDDGDQDCTEELATLILLDALDRLDVLVGDQP